MLCRISPNKRSRDGAHLLQQAQAVNLTPGPDEFAVSDLIDDVPSLGNLFPAWWNPHECAHVSSLKVPSDSNPISLSYQIFNLKSDIGKARSQRDNRVCEFGWALLTAWPADKIVGNVLRKQFHFPPIDAIFVKSPDQLLVILQGFTQGFVYQHFYYLFRLNVNQVTSGSRLTRVAN
jgi:hypothetical protein